MKTGELLGLRLGVAWTQAKRGEDNSAVLTIIFGLLMAACLTGTAWLAWMAARTDGDAGQAMLYAGFTGAGVFQIVAGFRHAMNRFFLTPDLELYLTAPIASRTLWPAKVLETAGYSPVTALGLLALAGGYLAGVRPAALPLIVLAAGTPLVAAGIGGITAVLFARYIPVRRLQPGLAFLTTFAGLGLALGMGNLPPLLFRAANRQLSFRPMIDALQGLPVAWPGAATAHLADGEFASGLAFAAVTCALFGASLAGGAVLFERLYPEAANRMAEAPERRRRSSLPDRLAGFLPPVVRPVVVKDWRVALRDPKQATAIIYPVVIVVVLIVSSWQYQTTPITNVLVVPAMFGASVQRILAMEGRNIALLKSAPVSASQIFVAKVAGGGIPAVLIGGVATAAIAGLQPGQRFGVPMLVLLGAVIVSVMVVFNAAIGVLFTDFAAPTDRPQVLAGLIGTFGGLLLLTCVAAPVLWLQLRSRVDALDSTVAATISFAPTAAALTLVWWLVRKAIGRLDRLDCP